MPRPSQSSTQGRVVRSVALDLGPSSVHAVEVELRADRAQVLKRGSASLPASVWSDPTGSRDALSSAMRQALASAGISSRSVVLGLPRSVVTMKHAKLPGADPEQLRGMVQFEAQPYIPFPLEEVVLDHQVVSEPTDDLATVLIVAARRALLLAVVDAAERAGIEVNRVSVSSMGLARHGVAESVPVAMVAVDHGSVDLAIVCMGRLQFSRSATIGNRSGGLVDEVARSIGAYQNEQHRQTVARLDVLGARDDREPAVATLSQAIAIPVAASAGALLAGSDLEAGPYATAVGLALEGIGGDLAPINLVPPERAEKRRATQRQAGTVVGIVVVGAIVIVAAAMAMGSMKAKRADRQAALVENERLATASGMMKKVAERHDALVKTYQVVAEGLGRDRPAVDVLKVVSDSVPRSGGVRLTQLTAERGQVVSVRGTARTETAATDLVTALQKSGAFTDVRLGYLGDAQSDIGGAGRAPSAPGAVREMSFLITCRQTPTVATIGGVTPAATGSTAGRPGAATPRGTGGVQ